MKLILPHPCKNPDCTIIIQRAGKVYCSGRCQRIVNKEKNKEYIKQWYKKRKLIIKDKKNEKTQRN